ncbi:MAG: glycosyltransferase family A protein [Campylobacterota bacterium]|nr:glycosyltransferase family A protein [Campylobacterota bacterium]
MNITTIIPTYNRAGFLNKTINSVLNQTIQPNEIIVVDDGSCDNTKDILEEFISKSQIIYIYQENKGVSSARNIGIKNAKYEWITFLDSDDIWELDKLEKQIDFHNKNKDIFFSYTGELWLFNNKIIKQKEHQEKRDGFCFEEHLENTLIGASTIMIKKSLFYEVGVFDESLEVCEDYDLWLRVLYKYQVGLIEEPLIKKIAGHKGQLSFITPMMDRYRIKVLLKYKDTKYSKIVKNIILNKCNILIKGAIKHNNKEIENYYKKVIESL